MPDTVRKKSRKGERGKKSDGSTRTEGKRGRNKQRGNTYCFPLVNTQYYEQVRKPQTYCTEENTKRPDRGFQPQCRASLNLGPNYHLQRKLSLNVTDKYCTCNQGLLSRYNVLLETCFTRRLLKENISLVRILQIISQEIAVHSSTPAERENKLLELSATDISSKDDILSNQIFQIKASEKRVKKKYQSKRIERTDLGQPVHHSVPKIKAKLFEAKQHAYALISAHNNTRVKLNIREDD